MVWYSVLLLVAYLEVQECIKSRKVAAGVSCVCSLARLKVSRVQLVETGATWLHACRCGQACSGWCSRQYLQVRSGLCNLLAACSIDPHTEHSYQYASAYLAPASYTRTMSRFKLHDCCHLMIALRPTSQARATHNSALSCQPIILNIHY
jgi:hypothetical protein